jgi:hypothetical protein
VAGCVRLPASDGWFIAIAGRSTLGDGPLGRVDQFCHELYFTRSVADVRAMAVQGADPPASLTHDVDAIFLPAADCYAERQGSPVVELVVTPSAKPLHFRYARGAGPETEGDIVGQFQSRTVWFSEGLRAERFD